MVVKQGDCIDRWQAVEIDCRRNPPSRTDELYWRRPLAPDGVRQNIQARYLDKEGGMSDPGECELLRRSPRHDERRIGESEFARVGIGTARISSSLDQRPLQEIRKSMKFSRRPRISKSTTRSMMVWSWHLWQTLAESGRGEIFFEMRSRFHANQRGSKGQGL